MEAGSESVLPRLHDCQPGSFPDNTVGDGKTKTCSSTHFLGGEEWIKDALLESCRNPRPCIAHVQFHKVLFHLASDGDQFAWHVRQGITCIGEQIDEDLFQLNCVAHNHCLICRKVHL